MWRSANLNDVVHPTATGEPEHFLVPVRSLLVIDDVRRSELLRNLELLVRRRSSNNDGTGGHCKLKSEAFGKSKLPNDSTSLMDVH